MKMNSLLLFAVFPKVCAFSKHCQDLDLESSAVLSPFQSLSFSRLSLQGNSSFISSVCLSFFISDFSLSHEICPSYLLSVSCCVFSSETVLCRTQSTCSPTKPEVDVPLAEPIGSDLLPSAQRELAVDKAVALSADH